jgi:triosephosphate isomerase
VRACLEELFGKKRAGSIPILYGGSVGVDNAKQIASQKDVNGVLVGGASLDPQTLAEIIHHISGSSTAEKPRKPRTKRVKK